MAPTVQNSQTLLDDMKIGWAYALKRRAKLVAYFVAAAGYLVNNGLVHGTLALYLNIGITVLGGGLLHAIPNMPPFKIAQPGTEPSIPELMPPTDGVLPSDAPPPQ